MQRATSRRPWTFYGYPTNRVWRAWIGVLTVNWLPPPRSRVLFMCLSRNWCHCVPHHFRASSCWAVWPRWPSTIMSVRKSRRPCARSRWKSSRRSLPLDHIILPVAWTIMHGSTIWDVRSTTIQCCWAIESTWQKSPKSNWIHCIALHCAADEFYCIQWVRVGNLNRGQNVKSKYFQIESNSPATKDQEPQLFPDVSRGNQESVITCILLTPDFLIYSTDVSDPIVVPSVITSDSRSSRIVKNDNCVFSVGRFNLLFVGILDNGYQFSPYVRDQRHLLWHRRHEIVVHRRPQPRLRVLSGKRQFASPLKHFDRFNPRPFKPIS